MEHFRHIIYMNQMILEDAPRYMDYAAGFSCDIGSQRRLLRGLMNVRPAIPLTEEYLEMQDELLSSETEQKGIVDVMSLPTTNDPHLVLWQGDITRLNADAIVNAANATLLGCFCPEHNCIDNMIHSAAGLQLRDECNRLMQKQRHSEPVGQAKITKGYNLPCRYVLHTVGPRINGTVSAEDREALASCYRSCLELAAEHGLESVAFCCISTGEFHFPNEEAAQIAIATVREFLALETSIKRVIFNVFKDQDLDIYHKTLASA